MYKHEWIHNAIHSYDINKCPLLKYLFNNRTIHKFISSLDWVLLLNHKSLEFFLLLILSSIWINNVKLNLPSVSLSYIQLSISWNVTVCDPSTVLRINSHVGVKHNIGYHAEPTLFIVINHVRWVPWLNEPWTRSPQSTRSFLIQGFPSTNAFTSWIYH